MSEPVHPIFLQKNKKVNLSVEHEKVGEYDASSGAHEYLQVGSTTGSKTIRLHRVLWRNEPTCLLGYDLSFLLSLWSQSLV